MAPTYLITAASGNVGKHLVPLLLSRSSDANLVLPTRDPARLISQIPSDADKTRVHVVKGNIQDPSFVQKLLEEHNVTCVFLNLKYEDEFFTTMNFFIAVRAAKCVKHLVYLSGNGHWDLATLGSPFMRDVWAAHVAVKFMGEAKLKYGIYPREQEGGFSYTIIGPSLFFSNDIPCKDGMLQAGFFGQPFGSKGVSRVDDADIALASAIALEDDGNKYAGKKIFVGSLKTYTMEETAELWSKALGKKLQYGLSDKAGLDGFEQQVQPFMGAHLSYDLRGMFEMFEHHGFSMSEEEYREQVEILGKEPNSYEKFVEDTARGWLEES